MSEDSLKEFKKTSSALAGKLKTLAQVKDDQKQVQKVAKDIKKLQQELMSCAEKFSHCLQKANIDTQFIANTNNDIKRALNQPSELNIQNAVRKMDDLLNKLAA